MDRVNWVVHECFHAAARLRAVGGSDSPAPAALHQSARLRVERLLARAAEAGFSSEDARLMAYAAVALLDEVAMESEGPLRAHWSSEPLQRLYFDESVAGERFFEHLARVLADPARVDVLRVFHLALALGFQGKHRVDGTQHALTALRTRVHTQLTRRLAMPASLSPDLDAAPVRRAVAPLAARWLVACPLLLVVVVVLSLRVSLTLSARALRAELVEASRERAHTEEP